MWLNKSEEAVFGPFMKFVYDNEDRDLLFIFSDGTALVVGLHLYEYESDNGLDTTDPNYEEYWEMAFEIKQVKVDEKSLYSVGDKVLVNYHNVPSAYSTIR